MKFLQPRLLKCSTFLAMIKVNKLNCSRETPNRYNMKRAAQEHFESTAWLSNNAAFYKKVLVLKKKASIF